MQCCVITVYGILSDTLAKMDGLSEKDASSIISPALPLKRKGLKTPLSVLLLKLTLKILCQREVGPERKEREKDSCSSKLCCHSTPHHCPGRLDGKGKKIKRAKAGERQVSVMRLVFGERHSARLRTAPSLPCCEHRGQKAKCRIVCRVHVASVGDTNSAGGAPQNPDRSPSSRWEGSQGRRA